MAGTGGASLVLSDGSGVGSFDSENGNKRIKSGEEKDRLSCLPDFLIHRILSHLPATDLVKTCVLSKWWKYQWTRVPVLKFVHFRGMSPDKLSNFIDKTLILHNCSNIDKFVIKSKCFSSADQFPNLDSWIRFAVTKDVKKLTVDFNDVIPRYSLPQFLFNNSSLLKLKLSTCYFIPIGKMNWGTVKSLRLYFCELEDKAIENVLCGSPLLQYLELRRCGMFERLVISSKSLKTLILDGVKSNCSLVEISCPNLERLRISGLVWFKSLKLMNLPSSVYATLDFYFEIDETEDEIEELEDDMSHDDCINLVHQTLRQVEHVEKLEIGRWMMEILSSSKEDGDCILGLPDSFIHRIISSLPSTKDAFKGDFYKICAPQNQPAQTQGEDLSARELFMVLEHRQGQDEQGSNEGSWASLSPLLFDDQIIGVDIGSSTGLQERTQQTKMEVHQARQHPSTHYEDVPSTSARPSSSEIITLLRGIEAQLQSATAEMAQRHKQVLDRFDILESRLPPPPQAEDPAS